MKWTDAVNIAGSQTASSQQLASTHDHQVRYVIILWHHQQPPQPLLLPVIVLRCDVPTANIYIANPFHQAHAHVLARPLGH